MADSKVSIQLVTEIKSALERQAAAQERLAAASDRLASAIETYLMTRQRNTKNGFTRGQLAVIIPLIIASFSAAVAAVVRALL